MGFKGVLVNKPIKNCIHNSKEKVTSEMLLVFTVQVALCALVTFEGKKMYLILNNSLVAAGFYNKLGWKIWFGLDVLLEVYTAGFICCRTRRIFECWVETKLCSRSVLAYCTCCCKSLLLEINSTGK